jgi:ubiquinone/menaquinone biosynthesis C-methylase UbiE
MDHAEHIRLIERGVDRPGGVWADLGAGRGAFTLALRDLAGPDVQIFAVDRDRGPLESLQREMSRRFPGTDLRLVHSDFTGTLSLPPLDGIIAANSIHFVPDLVRLLRSWRRLLNDSGTMIVVEYDTDDGNRWVPYPVSFRRLGSIARDAGLPAPELLATRGSSFMRQIYAASIALQNSSASLATPIR